MNNKKIIFPSPNRAILIEDKIGSPAPDEVLVELAYSTISSGTERANITGEARISINPNVNEVIFPRQCGYSSSGIVKQIGSNVKNVKVGDRVALSWSTHSKYCILNQNNVHKIEFDSVSLSEASICNIATFPLAAIRKCHLEIGESALVMGLGILGLIAVKLLRANGAYPIIAADPIPEKRVQALKCGADFAFDPLKADFAQKVKSVCSGVNVAIEVTGNGAALDSVLGCMARLGRVALLGCTRNSDFTIDYYRKVHGPGIGVHIRNGF